MNEISENKIEIFCPLRKCGKCTRMIKVMEILLKEEHIGAEIIIIDQLEDMLTKHTWICQQ